MYQGAREREEENEKGKREERKGKGKEDERRDFSET